MIAKKNNFRSVPTSILTINWAASDWDKLRQNCHIVRYDVPRNMDYGIMHNWYKQESNYPCYLHTHGPHLFVKYGTTDEATDLSYKGRSLHRSTVNVQDENLRPQILKLLLADYFLVDGRFVSNTNFFLWTTTDKDFITGLKIELKHHWKNKQTNSRQEDQFIISDQATRLRKLRQSDFDKIGDRKRKTIYYGRFYKHRMAVFKQLKPAQITREQLREGIYELYSGNPANRSQLAFHSIKSLRALKQTRSYLINQFIAGFVAYLNELGLPFQQKHLSMQPVHAKSTSVMKERQLPLEQKPIYIVDDRLNVKHQTNDFADRFCVVANETVTDRDVLFVVKPEKDLRTGDWALRLQDYEGDDFKEETGILVNRQDPKTDFYTRYPGVVIQTINVNKNSNKKTKKGKNKEPRSLSEEEYLN